MQRGREGDQTWPQDLNQDSLNGPSTDVDFTKFLELGNEFTGFEPVEQRPHHAPSGLDTPMGRLTFGHSGQVQPLTPQQQAMLHDMEMAMSSLQPQMDFQQMQEGQERSPPQYQQYNVYQQMHNPYQNQVPPTPVSTDMHAAKYTQSMDAGQLIFDRQNASFTPLVSPAQTPVDNQWGMTDYLSADDFFSPLTSPAIEAQQTFTNVTSSPVDLDVGQAAVSRKPRKKLTPASRVASARNLRSSPAARPGTRRKQNSMSAATSKGSQASVGTRQQHLLPVSAVSTAVSSEDSVSPEPLSELSMRPPPVPLSRTPNAIRPQSKGGSAPATPATLMRIPGKQAQSASPAEDAVPSMEIMEDISLPDAAASLPSRVLPDLDTSLIHGSDESTPTVSAKTPKLSAESTPRSGGTKAINGSHEGPPKPNRGGRVGKKRQSVSQAAISPALRPKISPSISPLVPSTGTGVPIMSAETSALYLASKSNYQNIIDGTHLPGVSYPETLAENLSSKRTSHKIAEQGRRNRINLALKEIESLLPESITTAIKKEKDSGNDESTKSEKAAAAAAQGASKASTVEMAIAYIKNLQSELKETKEKLEAAEKSIAEGNSSGSQTSEQTNA